MNLIKRDKFLLAISAILFLALGFFKLSSNPATFYADETDIALLAKSFTDRAYYKPESQFLSHPFALVLSPIVFFLGLNPLIVRGISVVFSLLSLVLMYFLVKRIFKSSFIALSSFFLLATTPGFLHFSRQAIPLTMIFMFMVLLTTFIVYYQNNWIHRLLTLSTFILLIQSVAPEINLHLHQIILLPKNLSSLGDFLYLWLSNSAYYLSYEYLFSRGDYILLRNGLNGELGIFLIHTAPLLAVGFFSLWQQKNSKLKIISFGLLITLSVLAGLNNYTPNSRIAFYLLLPLTIIMTSGWAKLRSSKFSPRGIFLKTFLFLILAYNLLLYFHLYHQHFYKRTGNEWYFVYQKVFDYIEKSPDSIFYLSNKYGNAANYLAFFGKVDLKTFSQEKMIISDKIIYFDKLPNLPFGKKDLVKIFPPEYSSGSPPLHTFTLLDNRVALIAY